MNAANRHHRWLKRIGGCLAVPTAASLVVCDLREWLIYFDPFPARFVLHPIYLAATLLPFLVVLAPAPRATSGNRCWLISTGMAMFVFQICWWSLIAIGTFCRDPLMNFHWPWEQREPRLEVLSLVNWSEYFWQDWLDRPLPTAPLLREAPGLVLLTIHLIAIPACVTFLISRSSHWMPAWRTVAFIGIVQVALLLPIKMVLRWTVDLKYVIAFPEWFLNL